MTTSTTTHGEPPSLLDCAESLDAYEISVGLPPSVANNAVEQYLGLSGEDLRRMTAEDLGEAAYLLAQFATNIQRATNRTQAVLDRVEPKIHLLISKVLEGCHIYAKDERRAWALRREPQAMALEKIRIETLEKITRLSFLVQRVELMVKTLLELQHTRRRQQ